MKTFKLLRSVYDQLLKTAEQEAPLEACGLLAGREDTALAFYPVSNTEQSPELYFMDPGEQFRAFRRIQEAGLEIVGIWHSHPHSAPQPSCRDLQLANMPEVSYLILSLAPGQRGQLRSFKKYQGEGFVEQPLEIKEKAGDSSCKPPTGFPQG